MSSGLKDSMGGPPPVLLLPSGEQQVIVSVSAAALAHSISLMLRLRIQVACRIRPMTEEEIVEGATVVAHKVADDNVSEHVRVVGHSR